MIGQMNWSLYILMNLRIAAVASTGPDGGMITRV